ncbi:hypothetical protein AB2M62_05135 [Sphingomonas sp. MMS12-HWE2-04]|uniref:hypothetical protein n=1 Tax=Sphingomonas sp. MMS12-HWE2-04 TaxID=3234199 RepID=UPI00384E8D34
MKEAVIERGQDYLATIRSEQYVELTPDLLGKGANLFSEFVTLIGAPLIPPVGNADTIMERLDDATPGKPVRTRIVAFANVSAAPVRIEGDSAIAGWYDLYVTLSPTRDSTGETVYTPHDEGGGTFESKTEFWPMFELRPLGGGPSIFIDSGSQKVPGFPMNIGSSGGRWTRRAPTEQAVAGFRAQPFFYEDEVVITASSRGQFSALVPLTFDGPTIAKCAKAQAELVDSERIGTYGRKDFGLTKLDANREQR